MLHPEGLRVSPIEAVVLTGGEIDQTAGLLSLRERSPFMLMATAATLAAVADNPMFGALASDVVSRRAITPGEKTGRRMGHMPIDGEGGSLLALEGLSARKIFVHINNTNPIMVDGSPERRRVESAGWEVAFDGMEIAL